MLALIVIIILLLLLFGGLGILVSPLFFILPGHPASDRSHGGLLWTRSLVRSLNGAGEKGTKAPSPLWLPLLGKTPKPVVPYRKNYALSRRKGPSCRRIRRPTAKAVAGITSAVGNASFLSAGGVSSASPPRLSTDPPYFTQLI
jgi:hypothetical protein